MDRVKACIFAIMILLFLIVLPFIIALIGLLLTLAAIYLIVREYQNYTKEVNKDSD